MIFGQKYEKTPKNRCILILLWAILTTALTNRWNCFEYVFISINMRVGDLARFCYRGLYHFRFCQNNFLKSSFGVTFSPNVKICNFGDLYTRYKKIPPSYFWTINTLKTLADLLNTLKRENFAWQDIAFFIPIFDRRKSSTITGAIS